MALKRTFHIMTFGCQMNANDSDWLQRALLNRGFQESGDQEASLIIINTCSVRDKPEQKVYSEIGRMSVLAKRAKRKIIIAVGGCVAQQVGKQLLARFPMVRLVYGTDTLPQVPNAIVELFENESTRSCLTEFEDFIVERPNYLDDFDPNHSPSSAFVNIMQGCDNFCSYCIVPLVRGRQKSRSVEAIVSECQDLVDHGCREITLLGQNVNSYGQDKTGDGTSFSSLLKTLLKFKQIERLRFMTAHPKDLSAELIQLLGAEEKLCPRLHLPVQSGSDRLLKLMNRKYTIADYLKKVEQVRKARPDILLSSDIIVGFPGETEADFKDTMQIIDEIQFLDIYSYIYSDRPGAKALLFNEKISRPLALERLQNLQNQQKQYTDKRLRAMLNTQTQVLVDSRLSSATPSVTPEGVIGWQGKDLYDLTVHLIVDSTSSYKGLMVPVEIIEARQHSLVARQIGDTW